LVVFDLVRLAFLAAHSRRILPHSLGYVAKLAIEQWRSISAARSARLAAVAELSALLRAGRVSFDIQNAHAQRLTNTLLERQAVTEIDNGYEQTITAAFPKFTADERELHGIIRSITIHAIRPVNQALASATAAFEPYS
jgi:hypothetical protein